MKVYIAGPMRGIRHYNFPEFDRARDVLIAHGHTVVSPADLDREVGFDALALPHETDWSAWPEGEFDRSACIQRDVAAVLSCDAIHVLHGWQQSEGARAEVALAKWAGLLEVDQLGNVIKADASAPAAGEVRVVDPKTGGEKGSKLARFDLIPAGPLWELAEHNGKGARKYADRNWERGYKWSLSYAALQRHLNQFWGGEDIDQETGSKHLVSAAWHCLALAEFMRTHPELDDRPKAKA